MNLFKTFIRSAVSQVGRDSGKVVSNKIYGDKHASPVKVTSSNTISKEQKGDIVVYANFTPDQAKTIRDNFKLQSKGLGWAWLLVPVVALIPFLSPLLFLFGAIAFFSYNESNYFRFKEVPNIVPDNRYKSGERQDGNKTIIEQYIIPANSEEKKPYMITGFLFLILLAWSIYWTIQFI